MFKRTYNVIYKITPNKKKPGRIAALNVTFDGRLSGNQKNQAKLLNALCRIHRVNPNALQVQRITLIATRLALREWFGNLFGKLLRRVPA